MSPRLFALLVCLSGSGKWPRLRYVAAALVFEFAANACSALDVANRAPIVARAVWFTPTCALVAVGTNLAAPWRHVVATSIGLVAVMSAFAENIAGASIPLVCGASLFATILLARQTVPRDVERSAILAALVGTVATSALALLVGTNDAYAKEVVSTSNQITHLAIAAIVLWAMRR